MLSKPTSSPWGSVDGCEVICPGIFNVETPRHGGIMVSEQAAGFLSPAAREHASMKHGDYLCYEEDCDYQIVLREVLDNGMWNIPADRDKEQYELNMNESLKYWNPEYWQAREQSIIEKADAMPDARKAIVFRDENYREKFRIKDGDSIKITVAYDGEEIIRKCRWLDETHMNVGSTCYHMDEFMEKQNRVGNTYEPVLNNKPMLDIVISEPGKLPHDAQIPLSFSALRELIGAECLVTGKGHVAYVQGRYGIGNGTLVVCGTDGKNLTSLHPYHAQSEKRALVNRTVEFAGAEKTDIASRLAEGKAKAAEHNAARPASDTPQRNSTVEH